MKTTFNISKTACIFMCSGITLQVIALFMIFK